MVNDDETRDFSEIDGELNEIRGALFDDTIALLSPAAPLCLPESATVRHAVDQMLGRRHAAVLVVDTEGRLRGIFTERDVLNRVVGRGLDPVATRLASVMTGDPEALTEGHRIAYAIHCMSVAGYRTMPLIDRDGRPVGIVTVNDVIRWLANLFPEAVLNLAPGDRLKNPGQEHGP